MTALPPVDARWCLWMDNPNKAAAFVALLAVPAIAFACRAKSVWAACTAWCAAAGLCFVLVQTHSRGGLVALAAGTAIVLVAERRRLCSPAKFLPLLVVAAVLVAAAFHSGFAARLARSSPGSDDSIANRFLIWRSVPAMMSDAPGGWGAGRSGETFMNWYQPLDRGERYRTLVNSFFTWLVEHGWPCRMAIVFACLFVLWLGVFRLKERGDPVPLAVWASFETAAFFSSVTEEWALWVLPMVALVPAAAPPLRRESRRRALGVAAMTLLCSITLLGAAAVLGRFMRPSSAADVRRSFDGSWIVLGAGVPRSWAVLDAAVVGMAYGHALREFALSSNVVDRAWGVAESVDAVPDDAERLALCGRSAGCGPAALSRFAALKDVRVLSPPNPSAWIAAKPDGVQVKVFCGDLSARCPADVPSGFVVVPGAADFLPSWPSLAFGR
jgi:hypothetical protein